MREPLRVDLLRNYGGTPRLPTIRGAGIGVPSSASSSGTSTFDGVAMRGGISVVICSRIANETIL
ncbi:UNVERIFIED_CONTAM: hypothetical protein Slati_1420800 [Sesamum latifolium]|uniref:Uncharacterized protein n=1 Tax=Sesamum latifolium TaxID=2727402 RepID=A0AAW2X404_9LAMI